MGKWEEVSRSIIMSVLGGATPTAQDMRGTLTSNKSFFMHTSIFPMILYRSCAVAGRQPDHHDHNTTTVAFNCCCKDSGSGMMGPAALSPPIAEAEGSDLLRALYPYNVDECHSPKRPRRDSETEVLPTHSV
jgi:hypothetical protein